MPAWVMVNESRVPEPGEDVVLDVLVETVSDAGIQWPAFEGASFKSGR